MKSNVWILLLTDYNMINKLKYVPFCFNYFSEAYDEYKVISMIYYLPESKQFYKYLISFFWKQSSINICLCYQHLSSFKRLLKRIKVCLSVFKFLNFKRILQKAGFIIPRHDFQQSEQAFEGYLGRKRAIFDWNTLSHFINAWGPF